MESGLGEPQDGPGRRRGVEPVGERDVLVCDGVLESVEFALEVVAPGVLDVVHQDGAADVLDVAEQVLREVGEVREVGRELSLGELVAVAREPVRHVHGVREAALLAVVGDVESGVGLFSDGVSDCLGDGGVELLVVRGFGVREEVLEYG